MLSKLLKDQNIAHIITREPGGTETGDQIRKILLQGNVDKLDAYSEFLCFAASRREHLKKIILPLLLNVNPKIGLARKNKITLVENRFENFKNEFHELVQKNFLELARKYDNRCRVINADNDKDFIFNEIIDQIKHFFSVTL